MLQPRNFSARRRGFTLLELMIAVAIIALLASMLMGAIFKVQAVKENLEARRELSMLENAIKAFAADVRFGQAGYIPSRLNPNCADGSDWRSVAYLRRLFPRTGGSAGQGLPDVQLEGHEVLVLMLGGPNNQGWSTDPQNPVGFDQAGKPIGQRIKFYDFDERRLRNTGKGTGNIKIYCYVDRWSVLPGRNKDSQFDPSIEMAIAYFCPKREGPAWEPPAYQDDCPSLGVKPYASQNLTSFQLITAGIDRRFGDCGERWSPDQAHLIYPRGTPGYDDFANFSPRQLGNAPR